MDREVVGTTISVAYGHTYGWILAFSCVAPHVTFTGREVDVVIHGKPGPGKQITEDRRMTDIPETMRAVVLMRHGGLDALEIHDDWPVPVPSGQEVLIRVGACGLNNTDVNTRSGWYSKAVRDATTGDAYTDVDADPTWGRSVSYTHLTLPTKRIG